jgi:FkbM family methyltransferase
MLNFYEINIGGATFNLPINLNGRNFDWQPVSRGLWEPKTFSIISKLLTSRDCALEVGIENGQTLYTTAYYAGKLIAIEPNVEYIRYAENILNVNPSLEKKVILLHGALSDTNEKVVFAKNNKLFDVINFNKDTVPTLIQCFLIEDLEQIVKTNITFINLDIEGGEYIVLPAMQNWLALRKPVLLLSLHPGFLLSEKHRRQIKFVRYLRRYWEQRKIFNSIKLYEYIYDVDSGNRISSFQIFRFKYIRSKHAAYSQILCSIHSLENII